MYSPSSKLRFGTVFKVPILHEDNEYVKETISAKVTAAERRLAPKKRAWTSFDVYIYIYIYLLCVKQYVMMLL